MNNTHFKPNLLKLYVLLATWFGSGLMKPAPGTWGSLAGLFPALFIAYAFDFLGLVGFIIVTFLLGLWSGKHFGIASGHYDDGRIVIDEVVGIAISLVPLAFYGTVLNPIYIASAFILFRAFDILKPFPVSYFDKRVPNAFGMMMDDVMAGLYTAFILWGALWFLS